MNAINCEHWTAIGGGAVGRCAIGKGGGKPSAGYCLRICRLNESRGLGDTVAKVAHAVGADRLAAAFTRATGKDCGCKGRQALLNRLVPYVPAPPGVATVERSGVADGPMEPPDTPPPQAGSTAIPGGVESQ